MQDIFRSQFRLPAELADKLREAAEVSGRSMNAEVVHRLEATFKLHPALLQAATVGESSNLHLETVKHADGSIAHVLKAPGGQVLATFAGDRPPTQALAPSGIGPLSDEQRAVLQTLVHDAVRSTVGTLLTSGWTPPPQGPANKKKPSPPGTE